MIGLCPAARPWRVLDEGNGGGRRTRGLVAIDQLRPFVAGQRLRIEATTQLNGLTFDAGGLQALLSRQRGLSLVTHYATLSIEAFIWRRWTRASRPTISIKKTKPSKPSTTK